MRNIPKSNTQFVVGQCFQFGNASLCTIFGKELSYLSAKDFQNIICRNEGFLWHICFSHCDAIIRPTGSSFGSIQNLFTEVACSNYKLDIFLNKA